MEKTAFEIRKLVRSLAIVSAILVPVLHTASAHAGLLHNWVSHNGSDLNNCSVTSPCATFGRALSQTGDTGQVSCLDSGNFDVFTVTLSVVIDCRGTVPTDLASDNGVMCGTGINVNAPGKVVTLRGLNLVNTFVGCSPASGIVIEAAAAVYIEDCVIESFPLQGILDERTSGLTKLVIKNTIVRNNGGAGIVAAATPKNSVVLENVQSVGNAYGIGAATGNNVVVSRSVMSGNTIAGIEADSGAQVVVDNTEVSHNASYGILAMGTLTLANSNISFNTSSISGATMSYGNNRIFGNGGGTAPTLIGQQ